MNNSNTTSLCHNIRYYICINKTWNLHLLPFLFWGITRDIILTRVVKLSSIFFQYLITGVAWHPYIKFYSCLFVIMYVAIYMLKAFQMTLPWCWSGCCHCDNYTHVNKSDCAYPTLLGPLSALKSDLNPRSTLQRMRWDLPNPV